MDDDSRQGDLAKAMKEPGALPGPSQADMDKWGKIDLINALSGPNATLDRAVDERTALLGLVRDVDGGLAANMTLRQWYAGMALQAVYGIWIMTHSTRGKRSALVEEAAAIADAMVEATDRDRPR